MPENIPTPEAKASLKTWITVSGALIGAFMAVLNIQVTNSSLPNIEGGLGTGGVNGTWINTTYLIGEIIVIPMSDYLSRVFSLRRYLIACTALFLLFSMACGQAHSLGEMASLRGAQGFFGGVLIPLAFTIVVTMLPPSQRNAGFAGFAFTATFAPSIGPTIGGWLTDNYGWRMIFYMNLVPGVVMLSALIYGLPRSKMQLDLLRSGDWWGMAVMAIGLAALQTVLNDGNVDDWFGSPFILLLSLISGAAFIVFLVIEFNVKQPLVPLWLLARRNFGLASLSNFVVGFALYGAGYLLPQYLANSQGFDAQQSGSVIAWTGLPQLLIIPFVPMLMRYFDSRLIVILGLAGVAGSCFMNMHLDANYAAPELLVPNIIRAFGQALVLTPLSALAVVGLAAGETGGASGLFNMTRNLGGAIGTAAIETFFTQREQYHSFVINAHVSLLQPATVQRLNSLQAYFLTHGYLDSLSAMHQAIAVVGQDIRAEATLMGYSDCFALIGIMLVIGALSVALLKKGPVSGEGGAH